MVATIDDAVGLQAGLAALDVEELLGAEVGAEAGFGHHVVGELQRGRRRRHRVAAVRDVGERAAVDEGRRAFQRLHQVRRDRVLEQRGHRAVGLELPGAHRLAVAGVADDDVAEPLLEVFEILGEAEDRHHFRRHGDVEAGLARIAVGDAAERADDLAQRAVVHVHDAAPGDAARVDAERIAPVDVVVDQRREQIVRRGDGVEVAGEVEVDVLHRDDLGVAAAGRAALHAEARAERRLAQAHIAFLPMWLSASVRPTVVVVLPSPAGVGVIAVTRISLPFFLSLQRLDVVHRHLGLVVAVGIEILRRDAELFLRDVDDAAASWRPGRFRCRISDSDAARRAWVRSINDERDDSGHARLPASSH